MTTSEWHVQILLDALHSAHPQTLTSNQLERCLVALRFAAPRWEDELRRREMAEMQRREMHLEEAA